MGITESRTRVLIIDDDAEFRYQARLGLENEGFQVVADVPNAETAIFALGAHQPDIVFLDLFLWGENPSTEAAKRIQAAAPDANIVLVSASPARAPVLDAMKGFGFERFVEKVDLDQAMPDLLKLKARTHS